MSKGIMNIQSRVAKERSPFTVQAQQMTAANYTTWHSEWGSLKTATDAIIAGVIRDETTVAEDALLDGSVPASNIARRELKLLIRYTGNVSGDEFRSELATPLLTALTMESGDANFVQLADGGVMAAFVTAFQTFARSPNDPTENVTIQSVQVVGRNI